MKFPYLAPRSALGPIRLDTYVERERVGIMADNAYDGSKAKTERYANLADPARITPEYKQWHARMMRKFQSR